MNDAMGQLSIVGIVGDHDDGGTVLVEFGEQSHHFRTVLRVEVTRWLVGKDELGTEDHGAGDGYALLLSAGELVREVLGTVADVHALHHLLHLLLALALRYAEIGERQFDVLFHIELVDEVETLKDEAYLSLADGRALVLMQSGHLFVAKPVLARGGVVEESEDVVGLSRSPRMLRSVDLPQPEGPMMATNSPSLTSNDTLSRAMVSTSSVRKVLHKSCTFIIAVVFIVTNGGRCKAAAY